MDKDFVEYFIKKTDERFDKVDDQLCSLDNKIEILLKFKWQIIGGAGVASVVVVGLIQLVARLAQ